MSLRQMLAIDGGGTKTDMVLFGEDGRVERYLRGPGCNPNDVGFDGACRILASLLLQVFPTSQEAPPRLSSVFAGLSGGTIGDYRQRFRQFLQETFPQVPAIETNSDAVSALSSGIGCGDGCVVISGTGSIVYARRSGELFRAGGWGYLLDRGGSGYDFGRDALYYALCAADGRGPDTALRGLVESALGEEVTKAVQKIYKLGKPYIASLAPLVFSAFDQGDWAAQEILRDNGRELAKTINGVSVHLPEENVCQTVLVGGVFHSFETWKPFVIPWLKRQHQFYFPQLPPVYGSALEALQLIGEKPGPGFAEKFQQGIEEKLEVYQE